MGKMLQVRNVPDDLHAELRRRAAAAGMSLSDYVLRELRRVGERSPMAEVLARSA
ncbi:FitA-like ribbon-helix-helix domain-containing protein, partial [Enterococcus faecalis]